MNFIHWVIVLLAFGFGIFVGGAVERRFYNVSEDKTCLTYEGAIYVRAIEGTSLEDYMTAAGKPKRGK